MATRRSSTTRIRLQLRRVARQYREEYLHLDLAQTLAMRRCLEAEQGEHWTFSAESRENVAQVKECKKACL